METAITALIWMGVATLGIILGAFVVTLIIAIRRM